MTRLFAAALVGFLVFFGSRQDAVAQGLCGDQDTLVLQGQFSSLRDLPDVSALTYCSATSFTDYPEIQQYMFSNSDGKSRLFVRFEYAGFAGTANIMGALYVNDVCLENNSGSNDNCVVGWTRESFINSGETESSSTFRLIYVSGVNGGDATLLEMNQLWLEGISKR